MKTLSVLSGLGLFTLFSEIFGFKKRVRPMLILGLLAAFVVSLLDWNTNEILFHGMWQTSRYSVLFSSLLILVTLIWFLLFPSFFSNENNKVDHAALTVFALTGAICMVSFNNMIMLFLGIEILSISMYILAGSNKADLSSNESALKYFLMGAFATGFLLFGIALVYGFTGSFELSAIAEKLSTGAHSPMLTVGMLLLVIAMAFKVSAAPFHFWAPDVYQGAPTTVTALMSTVVKTAAFAAFFRLCNNALLPLRADWTETLVIISGLTILMGNIAAVVQSNIKRMLAYSSVAHAGYMLLAVITLNVNAMFIYATAYSIASLSAFTILLIISSSTSDDTIAGFRGLARKSPILAMATIVAMLSLAGIPPAAGFFAKYHLFAATLSEGHIGLVLIAVAGSLIGVYYYFRPIMALFSSPDGNNIEALPALTKILLIILALLTLVLGIAPAGLTGLMI
jgi:NADH-quinone oxidoreductase subunit N